MTIHTVSNQSQFDAALAASVGGDTIKMNGGNYGILTRTSSLSKSSEVIITRNSIDSVPVFEKLTLTGANNLTFDGINFTGTAVESTKNGIQYPLTDDGFRFNSSSNITVRNFVLKFYRNGLKLQTCGSNILLEWGRLHQCGVDPFLCYGSCDELSIRHVLWDDFRIDGSRRNESSRHPDAAHIRVNDDQVGSNPMSNLTIEDCVVIDKSGYAKAFFMTNEINTIGLGYPGLIVRRCYIEIGRWSAISFTGATNILIEDILIRKVNAGVAETPTIAPEQTCSGIIRRVVTPRAIYYSAGANAGMFSLSNITVSDTAVPSGWVMPVAGPYLSGEEPEDPVKPDTPNVEWAGPGLTNSQDGRFAAADPITEHPGYYTGALIIPAISVARAASLLNNTASGVDVPNFRWSGPGGISGGFRTATPAVNSAGWRRFEMVGNDLSEYARTAGNSLTGLTWEYEEELWSDPSTYPGAFTAPGIPPVDETLDPLEANQWEVLSTEIEVVPGKFTQQIHEIAGLAPEGIVAMQWLYGSTWLNCVNMGTQSGGTIWQPAPSAPGNLEHTVDFEGSSGDTLTFYVRYSTGGEFSEQSVTSKSFTGPTPPPPVDPYEVGQKLRLIGGGNLNIAGRQATIPRPNRLGPISIEPPTKATIADGVITVQLPESPPTGADGQAAFYAGERYVVDAAGQTSFPEVDGITFLIARAFVLEAGKPYHGDAIYLFPEEV